MPHPWGWDLGGACHAKLCWPRPLSTSFQCIQAKREQSIGPCLCDTSRLKSYPRRNHFKHLEKKLQTQREWWTQAEESDKNKNKIFSHAASKCCISNLKNTDYRAQQKQNVWTVRFKWHVFSLYLHFPFWETIKHDSPGTHHLQAEPQNNSVKRISKKWNKVTWN